MEKVGEVTDIQKNLSMDYDPFQYYQQPRKKIGEQYAKEGGHIYHRFVEEIKQAKKAEKKAEKM